MCAIMLKHVPMRTTGFFGWFNRQVTRVTLAFGDAVTLVIKRMAIALVLMAVMLWGIYELFRILPSSFVPNEDQGYVMAAIIMPQSASLDRTQVIAQRVDAAFSKIPGVDKRAMITGYSLLDSGFKTNSGAFFVTLKDFKERYASLETAREQNARAVLTTLFKEVQSIEGAIVVPIAPPPIPGIGTTGGFEFWIQDTGTGDPTALDGVMQEFIAKARQRPELTGLATTFRANTQQLRADVDRDKATLLGVPVQDVYSAIQAQFGSLTASQYNQFSRVWWVIVQSDAQFRQTPDDLTRLYTRSNQNKMIPLSTLVSTHLGHRTGPAAAFQWLSRRQDQRQRRAGLQFGTGHPDDGRSRQRGAATRLYVRVVRPRVRGKKIRQHLGARIRVRTDHRLPGPFRAIRILDLARSGNDRGAVRDSRRPRDELDARP